MELTLCHAPVPPHTAHKALPMLLRSFFSAFRHKTEDISNGEEGKLRSSASKFFFCSVGLTVSVGL